MADILLRDGGKVLYSVAYVAKNGGIETACFHAHNHTEARMLARASLREKIIDVAPTIGGHMDRSGVIYL